MTPLHAPLNTLVLDITATLMPFGYDVADDAPDTFEALVSHVNATGRILVWSGASDRTIFGDPAVNHAFRAWHDWHHVTSGLPFTPSGELTVMRLQQDEAREHPAWDPLCDRLLRAEIAGQLAYQAEHGDFPDDQRAFARAYCGLQ